MNKYLLFAMNVCMVPLVTHASEQSWRSEPLSLPIHVPLSINAQMRVKEFVLDKRKNLPESECRASKLAVEAFEAIPTVAIRYRERISITSIEDEYTATVERKILQPHNNSFSFIDPKIGLTIVCAAYIQKLSLEEVEMLRKSPEGQEKQHELN